jgi:hypothetical protein
MEQRLIMESNNDGRNNKYAVIVLLVSKRV